MLPVSAPNFGDLLRGHRLAAGLTQEALAERAGLSVHGIQKLERGAAHPYRDTAQRLITALQLESEAEANLRAAAHPVRRRGSILRGGSPARAAEHNLPAALSSIVGREEELAQVMARLAGVRLLTLTGIGGCGKTRLALEMARALVQNFPDGVWLVELGPLSDAARVPHQVAAVLGVRESAQEPVLATLASALARRRLLLVLDNCEHVVDVCANLIDGLLKSCPGLKVLATSREPICISGEVGWRVPSLAIPDLRRPVPLSDFACIPAVQLFVERASAQTGFALSERNAEATAQVCHRLDGIPLALELAAGRLDALSVEQLAARLDKRFLLLTGGSRAALPRQQTLEATLDWSYDLLSKPERHLFERLSVFVGTWTLEAAEAVCRGRGLADEDVLDLLGRLVRKSLVAVGEPGDGAKRFELLETVRDYARQRLLARGTAETTAVRERHAVYYSSLADRLHPTMTHAFVGWLSSDPTLPPARRRFEEVQHDLWVALEWWSKAQRRPEALRLAVTLSAFWTWFGRYAEARHCLDPALDLAGLTPLSRAESDGPTLVTVPASLRARALWMVGAVAHFQGKHAEACVFLQASAALLRAGGDRLLLGYVLNQLGLDLWLGGDLDRATGVLDESLVLSREDGDAITRAGALRNVGVVARFRGEYERAAALLRESIAEGERASFRDGWAIARGLCNLARVAYLQDEIPCARGLLSQTFAVIHESQFAGSALADALEVLGAVEAAEEQAVRAATLLGAAETQWRASGGSRFPPDQPDFDLTVTRIRAALDADTYAMARREGQTMSGEQAMQYSRSSA
jgi:predicted ATPase/DNA-binding XRE family transcriptional regulator